MDPIKWVGGGGGRGEGRQEARRQSWGEGWWGPEVEHHPALALVACISRDKKTKAYFSSAASCMCDFDSACSSFSVFELPGRC